MEQKQKESIAFQPLYHAKRGLFYGFVTLVVGWLMGALFGLFYLSPIQPAMAFSSFLGVFVVLNLLISTIFVLVWLLVRVFKRLRPLMPLYFFTSLGFGLVYLAFFGVIKLGGLYYF